MKNLQKELSNLQLEIDKCSDDQDLLFEKEDLLISEYSKKLDTLLLDPDESPLLENEWEYKVDFDGLGYLKSLDSKSFLKLKNIFKGSYGHDRHDVIGNSCAIAFDDGFIEIRPINKSNVLSILSKLKLSMSFSFIDDNIKLFDKAIIDLQNQKARLLDLKNTYSNG